MPDSLDRLNTTLADRYHIESEIGSGGMATVYLAQDLKHHRKVAIKILKPELAAVLGGERFVQEITTTAQLQHPNILSLFDSGSADGFPYYVMPYIEGETLRQKLARETQLAVEEAVRITTEVGDALDYAHRHGVVHRDIKPENILLQAGRPIVADFGIAIAVQQAAGPRLTETGLSLGTPAYMSPEQATGDRAITAASDVYSLASVLYEMLTGDPPFTGTNVRAMIARIVTETPTPVIRVRPSVPRHVSVAVERALDKVPADRFVSGRAFAAALTADEARAGTEGGPIAVLPFTNMSADPENEFLADGIAEEIINALTKLEGLRVVARTSAFAFKGRQEDLRSVGRQLGVDHILEGSVRRAGNRLRVTAQLVNATDGYHLWSERYDRTMDDVFAVQDEISQAIVDTLKLKLHATAAGRLVTPGTGDLEAYNAFLKGLYFWNRRGPNLERALRHFEAAARLDPGYARAWAALADTQNLMGFYRYAPPREAFPAAMASARRALEIDPAMAPAHTSLGFALTYYDWDWVRAEQAFRRSRELDPNYATNHHWYAEFLMLRGRLAEAVAGAEHARDLDPIGLILGVMVGWAYYYARRFDDAIRVLQGTLDLDPEFVPAYVWLAPAHLLSGHPAEAAETCRLERDLSGDDGSLTLHVEAAAVARSGDTEAAEPIVTAVERRAATTPGYTWEAALAHAGLGHREATLTWLERAVEERSPLLASMAVEPLLDPMRDDPRFHAVLDRVGLTGVAVEG